MTSLTSNTLSNVYYLTKVKYLPERKSVAVDFSNLKGKTSREIRFFPSMLYSLNDSGKKLLLEVLTAYDSKKYKVGFTLGSVKIEASTFSDLKKISDLVFSSMNSMPLLLEPERQFLLQKNWSYFEGFEFDSMEQPVKNPAPSFPSVFLDFLHDSLNETLADLLKFDESSAMQIMKSISLSKLLRIPQNSLPETLSIQTEALLENIFFKNSFAPPHALLKEASFSKAEKPNGFFSNLSELDFSSLWPKLLTNDFYNIGFETLNCSCCKPAPTDINAENLLPNSLVEAKFSQSGFYFESFDQEFAQEFHEKNPLKENRLKRKKEFFLKTIPVGPFEESQRYRIPLNDAVKLLAKGEVKINGNNSLKWFCMKKESFVSAELKELSNQLLLLDEKLKALEKKSAIDFNLLSSKNLSKNINYLFFSESKKTIFSIMNHLPVHLLSPKSRFFSPDVAEAIKAIQSATIKNFSDFSREKGHKLVHSTNYRAFIESDNAFSLTKEFAEKEKIPLPNIVKRHKTISFY